MRPTAQWLVLALLVSVLAAGCTVGGVSPGPTSPSPTSPAASASTGPTSEPSDKPTFEVKQQGSNGPEVTVFIFDATHSLMSARGAADKDSSPLIASEVEPRIGEVPGAPNDLRVLWGGGVCDTAYTVQLTENPAGGLHADVTQGPQSSPYCDSLGVRRGVVLTFSAPVDAMKATGAFHSAMPQ